ncbi:DUF1801 domain-containing protein [Algibacter sp. PT7-4]|uniref:DUF1801 domain-containing protein n=1 Tax=Algibacter ulvanivorans TaxID=3400999 RepID=UPI003AAD2F8B
MLPNEKFYLSKTEPNLSCLLTLRDFILKQDNNITETTKYGMPCFCFKKKMFCYLWINKKTNMPYLLFVEGAYLNHPELVTGTRKRMKIFNVNPNKDIPLDTIKILLNTALNLYKLGKVPLK